MGSTISSAARTTARTGLKEAPGKAQKPTITPKHATATSTPKPHPTVTARLQNSQPLQYHRKTTEEWSETLKKISGAITSSSWQGEVEPHVQNHADKRRHSAQRSDEANQRLPGRRTSAQDAFQRDEHGMLIRPKGRLTQTELLHIFNLRRENPQKWDAAAIAKEYRLNEQHVIDLLSFSRTYSARMDSDGQVRGYYNSDPENTISRFEKD